MKKNLLKQHLSQILRDKKAELKCSQAKMAELCCISDREYSDLENDKALPQFQTLVNMLINLNLDFNKYIETIVDMGYKAIDNY